METRSCPEARRSSVCELLRAELSAREPDACLVAVDRLASSGAGHAVSPGLEIQSIDVEDRRSHVSSYRARGANDWTNATIAARFGQATWERRSTRDRFTSYIYVSAVCTSSSRLAVVSVASATPTLAASRSFTPGVAFHLARAASSRWRTSSICSDVMS